MIKEHISYYDEHKVPTSLRDIPIFPELDGRVEYFFYAVNLSRNFDELTEQFRRIIAAEFVEQERRDKFIIYTVFAPKKPMYLKVKIKIPKTD